MARVHLHVLGPARVERAGAAVQGFESRKAFALLCYLALQGQPSTRGQLAELFWGERPESRGRGNLNRVIHNLAQVVPGCITTSRQTLGIASSDAIWLDTSAFETLAAQGDARSLAAAAELYRGELLADLVLDDCPEFDQWLNELREHWRQQQIRLLQRLVAHQLQRGSAGEGIGWAERLLRIDPWNEAAHRSMMRLLAQSGQRSAALAQYESCRRVLADELGVDPEAETVALAERIRAGDELPALMVPLAAIPPTRLAAPQRSLPTPTTSFINRVAEQAEALARLRDPDCRLLTLVGPGGIGKSRLALQVAHLLAPESGPGGPFMHGAAFVPLATVEVAAWDEADVPAAMPALATSIAAALSLSFSGPEAPHTQVLNYLREKELLLVLDNFEHLLASAGFLVELLQQAPGLKMLVTSRARLNVPGEQIIEIGGLGFPNGSNAAQRTDMEHYSALLLFQERAQAVHPRFRIDAEERAVAHICQLVDGLPLGIELAASWVRLLPCEEIAREIEANLGFLQSSQRDGPKRHRSLRAVFDHSWNGLTAAEQRVLGQLSVFRGGFDRVAAAQVADATLPLLATLMDNSLVRRASDSGDSAPAHYELQEVVRQYAAEKLAALGGTAEPAVRDRHCRYYLTFLHERTADLRGERQSIALAMIDRAIENIRAAWRWAITQGHVVAIGQASDSLFHFYDMRSYFQEGAIAFAQAAARLAERAGGEHDAAARLVWGRLLARQGWFTFHLGQQADAKALLEQSLAIIRPLAQAAELLFPLNYLAAVNYYLGAYADARRLCDEGLALSQASGDDYGAAIANNILGQIAYAQGDYPAARRACQQSLAIERASGNRWSMAYSLTNLGTVAYALGEYQEARRRFQESMAIRDALGDARGRALCLNYLGDTAEAQADYAEAMRCYQESLSLFTEIGNQWGMAAALIRLGYNALALAEPAAARAHFQAALQTAMRAQALPSVLDALAGIAAVQSAADPLQALVLSQVVVGHPSTTKETSDRVAELRARLESATVGVRGAAHVQLAIPSLSDVVSALLHDE
jgi:predicted ATPase/DNA-binding SARP family transcriptional activator